jgi:single-strand DNA-binding protein
MESIDEIVDTGGYRRHTRGPFSGIGLDGPAISRCPPTLPAANNDFVPVSGRLPVPTLVSALLRGFCGARRLRSLCFACGTVPVLAPPCRYPQKSSLWSWVPRPLAYGCPRQRARTGETYVPQQNPLIGFLGNDAEKKVSNATNVAVFSLAWKNDAGSWESRTEWHRCVAFGKLADFAATLAKGAHVAIEGELRSHEYRWEVAVGVGDQKTFIAQRVWEIVSTRCSSSTAPPSAIRSTTVMTRCPAKGHLLALDPIKSTHRHSAGSATQPEDHLEESVSAGFRFHPSGTRCSRERCSPWR